MIDRSIAVTRLALVSYASFGVQRIWEMRVSKEFLKAQQAALIDMTLYGTGWFRTPGPENMALVPYRPKLP